jgi:hypothetical protein
MSANDKNTEQQPQQDQVTDLPEQQQSSAEQDEAVKGGMINLGNTSPTSPTAKYVPTMLSSSDGTSSSSTLIT